MTCSVVIRFAPPWLLEVDPQIEQGRAHADPEIDPSDRDQVPGEQRARHLQIDVGVDGRACGDGVAVDLELAGRRAAAFVVDAEAGDRELGGAEPDACRTADRGLVATDAQRAEARAGRGAAVLDGQVSVEADGGDEGHHLRRGGRAGAQEDGGGGEGEGREGAAERGCGAHGMAVRWVVRAGGRWGIGRSRGDRPAQSIP